MNTVQKNIVITLFISLAAGAVGGYFAVTYFGAGQGGKVIVGKETITEKEYIPQTTHEQKVVNVVKEVSGGVVSVIASKDVPVFDQFYRSPFRDNPLFEQFFPEFQVPDRRQNGTERQQVSAGTGFVVSKEGHIITNRHVVADEDADYTVITNTEKKYSAEVLARDPVHDLAILKVDFSADPLPVLKLGDSDSLQPGQSVIAIGNALGEFQNTVSAGVISGLKRTIVASSGIFGQAETLEELIQTDTAINRGNSGGPLLNLSGEVIGINVAMASGAENIGFAIPVNRAKKDIEDVEAFGKIVYPFLGVRYMLVSEELVEKNNLSVDYGALVIRGEEATDLAIVPGSAADKAGIVENDIILEVNGPSSAKATEGWEKVTQGNSLAKLIQKYNVGDTITLKILSKGEEKQVQATLGER